MRHAIWKKDDFLNDKDTKTPAGGRAEGIGISRPCASGALEREVPAAPPAGSRPMPTGPKPENPYCTRCSKHLGLKFHETNEHDNARARDNLHARFDAIVSDEDRT